MYIALLYLSALLLLPLGTLGDCVMYNSAKPRGVSLEKIHPVRVTSCQSTGQRSRAYFLTGYFLSWFETFFV